KTVLTRRPVGSVQTVGRSGPTRPTVIPRSRSSIGSDMRRSLLKSDMSCIPRACPGVRAPLLDVAQVDRGLAAFAGVAPHGPVLSRESVGVGHQIPDLLEYPARRLEIFERRSPHRREFVRDAFEQLIEFF